MLYESINNGESMTDIKDWQWLDHINDQIEERGINSKMIEEALVNPDQIVPGKNNRNIYQKRMEDKLLRVVTEDNRLITAYLTSKINKYIKGDQV
jgi:hypothetical protein